MRKEAVYYRKTDIKKFEDFEDGDCICEVCNGWGYFYDCYDNKVSQCYHCRGKGKLDWITNVTGVAGMSGTTGGAGISGPNGTSGMNGTSGYGSSFIGKIPTPPIRKIPAAKKFKATINQLPKIKIIPYKADKKISWRQKVMNAVADK